MLHDDVAALAQIVERGACYLRRRRHRHWQCGEVDADGVVDALGLSGSRRHDEQVDSGFLEFEVEGLAQREDVGLGGGVVGQVGRRSSTHGGRHQDDCATPASREPLPLLVGELQWDDGVEREAAKLYAQPMDTEQIEPPGEFGDSAHAGAVQQLGRESSHRPTGSSSHRGDLAVPVRRPAPKAPYRSVARPHFLVSAPCSSAFPQRFMCDVPPNQNMLMPQRGHVQCGCTARFWPVTGSVCRIRLAAHSYTAGKRFEAVLITAASSLASSRRSWRHSGLTLSLCPGDEPDEGQVLSDFAEVRV